MINIKSYGIQGVKAVFVFADKNLSLYKIKTGIKPEVSSEYFIEIPKKTLKNLEFSFGI